MSVEKEKTKVQKIFSIALNVLTYLFFAICIFSLVISVASKKDQDGAANIFGKQARIVVSNSMEKCAQTDVSGYKIKDIPVKSMIFIDLVPENEEEAEEWFADLKKGDVLTFRYVYVKQETITHRISKDPVKNANGGYTITLEGDNKNSDGNTLTQVIDTSKRDTSTNYIIGKVTGKSHFIGLLITAVKSPAGIVGILIVPCLIIMGFEIFRIVSVCTEKKREEERKKNEQRDNELEDLKKQLAALQQSAAKETEPTPQEEKPSDELVSSEEPTSQEEQPSEERIAPTEERTDEKEE